VTNIDSKKSFVVSKICKKIKKISKYIFNYVLIHIDGCYFYEKVFF